MPLPKPHDGESEQDFVSRCVAFVVDDGTVENTEAGRQQGAAMCFRQWRDNKSADAVQHTYHAYSFLHIKSFNEDERIIEGVATTPTPDRVDDVVDPMGAKFNLPMPLLWQHRHDQPIGEIFWAKPTKDGIPFKGRIAKTDEPGTLKSRLDEAWQSIKLKLVRAVSIGFRALEMEPINPKDPFGGQRFKQWEWLELSAVTIPANVDASIQIVRSIDKELRAATGQPQSLVVLNPPGDTGNEQTKPAGATASQSFKIEKDANMAKKTNSERIVDLENRRAAEVAAREAIQQKVTDEGRTKDDAEQQAFDEHSATIKGIDRELVDCRLIEAEAKAAAVPVQGQSMELATASRGGAIRVSMKANRPPGIGMSRVALAKMAGSILQRDPILVAQERWPSDDELHAYMKTAVASINTTTNGEELAVSQNMPAEFVEYLRPRTILGRVPGFRRVPFNITIPRQSGGTSGHWVGEGKAKPLDRPTFDSITLRWAKVATIVVFNQETAKFSNPAIETLVRDDLAQGISQFLDEQFFDPSVAEVSNVSPASITNGVDTDTADGETIAALIGDFTEAIANFQNAEVDTDGVVIVMRSTLATQISMMMNPLGQQAFPNINPNGGSIFGFPVYTSTNAGSGRIIFFKPSECLVADDGGVAIDISTQASLQMDDSPTAAAQSLVSLWQTNQIGVRAERWINYKMRRADAVYYISSANYGTAGTA